MKIRLEIITTILFILFVALIFGYAFTRNNIFNEMLIGLCILIIFLLIVYISIKILKNPHEIIENFKNQQIIMKILLILFIISVIYDLITNNSKFISSIILLILIIAKFCEWFLKKEE